MTYSFTTQDIVDILMQKPERKTAGLLGQINAFERFENSILTSYKSSERADFLTDVHRELNSSLPLKAKLSMVFEKEATSWSTAAKGEVKINEAENLNAEQRSLKQALLELKAVGFSHRQIYYIAIFARGALSSFYHGDYGDSKAYRDAIAQELGIDAEEMRYRSNDEGFLGGQVMLETSSGLEWKVEDHSMIPCGYETILEDRLTRNLDERLQMHPNLFTPDSQRKARRLNKA